MFEYTQEVRQTNPLARNLTVVSYVAAGVLVLCSGFLGSYSLLAWTLAVLFLTAAVFLTVTYSLRSLSYRLEQADAEGKYDFVVIDTKDKTRRMIDVRLSFDGQIFEWAEGKAALDAAKKQYRPTVYTYVKDLRPAGLCGIIAHDGAETVLVQIVPDARMKELILQLLAASSARQKEERDE